MARIMSRRICMRNPRWSLSRTATPLSTARILPPYQPSSVPTVIGLPRSAADSSVSAKWITGLALSVGATGSAIGSPGLVRGPAPREVGFPMPAPDQRTLGSGLGLSIELLGHHAQLG